MKFTNKIAITVCASIMVISLIFGIVPVVGVKTVEAMAETSDVKTADVYMIAGQSNAAGSTRVDATPGYIVHPFAPTKNVLYFGETHRTVTGGSGRRISDFRPVQHGCGFTDEHVGFELGLAETLNDLDEYKGENKKAIIFKSAAGGSRVMPDGNYGNFGNWYPRSLWEEDYYATDENGNYLNFYDIVGFQYRLFFDNFADAYEAMQQRGYQKIQLKGLFWMQGESDRDVADDYVKVCSTLFNDFRTDLSLATGDDYSDLPIYVGEISKTFGSATVESVQKNENLINAQYKIASSMKNVYVVKTGDYAINKLVNGTNVVVGSDNSHWNYEDVLSVGRDFADMYLGSYGKTTDNFVNVVYDESSPINALTKCTLKFTGAYGANFGAETDEVDFRIDVPINYSVSAVSAENANLEIAETGYEGDSLSPYVKYKLVDLQNKNVNLNVTYVANKAFKVNVTCSDETYGRTPNSKNIALAYTGNKYRLTVFPSYEGAVEKLIINGVEVNGKKDISTYVFDDWYEKFNVSETKKMDIEVVYGEYNEVNKKLAEIENPPEKTPTVSCKSSATMADFIAYLAVAGAVLLILRRH